MRVICTYLMDIFVNDPCETRNQDLILRARETVWIQESIMWKHSNYDRIRVPTHPDKFFLLLINQLRVHRRQLLSAVEPYLADSLHTCVANGIMLPDEEFVPGRNPNSTANDRNYVPRWYAETCFSLVSETMTDSLAMMSKQQPGTKLKDLKSTELFISEKSFKPLAHCHPFVIQGTPGTLNYLQGLGFETFAHVIDESYDQELDHMTRSQKMLQVIQDLYQEFKQSGGVFQDSQTKQKLEHNYNLFFNQHKIDQLFSEQIVRPIIEFLESK